MSALLTLDRLAAATPDGRTLFHDLTLSIGAQERVGLVGRNGSGKSTLLAIIANNLAPAAGHVALSGRIGTLARLTDHRQTLDAHARSLYLDRWFSCVTLIACHKWTDGSVLPHT